MLKEFIVKQKAKNELITAFSNMGLYKTYKKGNGKELKAYPKIHSVDINHKEKTLEYVFTLLNGLDPKELDKKEFVLEQHFGKNFKLEGDVKKFVLTIYTKEMSPELKYNFDDILPTVRDYKLGILCGKNRNGEYVAFELLKHPHILIAGETGSGKSTQLRSILTTLIKTKRPDELHLYLADCKRQEFHIFRRVEHVQGNILSSVHDIKNMLYKIKQELEDRSQLTELFEVGHIDDLPEEHRRPYIIVCIDEFVKLRRDEEIMDILIEIVAIGRTLGVFAILSMQRPNAKVLDTTIRANLTVSMGFKLRDKIEARIVNTPGAESIEKSGRFIMNSDKIYEIQAPYLKMEEAKKLLNPFMVSKGPIKEVNKTPEETTTQLTEKDVFY